MNTTEKPIEIDVEFKVTGRADWETHAQMIGALSMVKGVKCVVDHTFDEDHDHEKPPRTCAEAKERFEKKAQPRPPYLILGDLKLAAEQLVGLMNNQHPGLATWNEMLARRLGDIQRLVREYDAMIEFDNRGETTDQF